MGYNEMCAYLHAEITNTDGDGLNLYYDDHYCAYFEKNPSYWTLELSDSFRKKTGGDSRVSITEKPLMQFSDQNRKWRFRQEQVRI